jgi:hypothetical protein
MEIKRAADFDEDIRREISRVFVETYESCLQSISKNTSQLVEAFAHIFVVDSVYVAVNENEIVGIVGYLNKDQCNIKPKKMILMKYLGILNGLTVSAVLNKYCNKYPECPVETDQNTVSIGFFAMASKYRKMCYLVEMMEQFFLLFEKKNFIVEIAHAETNVIKMYEQIGFREIYRKFPKVLYMKKQCSPARQPALFKTDRILKRPQPGALSSGTKKIRQISQ